MFIALSPENWTLFLIEFWDAFHLAGEGLGTMKASKFSEAREVFILKQGEDGMPISCPTRAVGFGRWKTRTAGSRRAWRIWRWIGKCCRTFPSKNLRPVRKRELVDKLCTDLGFRSGGPVRRCPLTVRVITTVSRRSGQAALEQRIKAICQTRIRYGYRRVQVILRREGWMVNHKRTRRIYRELGLQQHYKPSRRWVRAKLREDRQAPTVPNQLWAMDFVHDPLSTGRNLRILTVVDVHSRYCPATDARYTYRGDDGMQNPGGVISPSPGSWPQNANHRWRRFWRPGQGLRSHY